MKKKKLSIREQREQKMLNKKAVYQQIEEKKKTLAEENEIPDEAVHTAEEDTGIHKSSLKRAGLKSTFFIEDKIVMTSYGKGNNSVLEKKIENKDISSVNNPEKFKASIDENAEIIKHFDINSKVSSGIAENPKYFNKKKSEYKSPQVQGMDNIRLKPQLEKRYYGTTFNDNLHIQIIYNILDIEKNLAVYANNITYIINRCRRETVFVKFNNYYDFIGNLHSDKSYNKYLELSKNIDGNHQNYQISFESFTKIMKNNRLEYFDDLFTYTPKNKKKKNEFTFFREKHISTEEQNILNKRAYDVFCMFSSLRQFCTHGDKENSYWLYSLETALSDNQKIILDELYSKEINNLNENFISKNAKSLAILFKIFDANSTKEKKRITQQYYDFIIKKSYKTLGFSIKNLRETMMLSTSASVFKEEEFDTVRNKLNKMFDFILYDYYEKNKNEVENFVATLRASGSKAENERIYNEKAKQIWSKLENTFLNKLKPEINGNVIKNTNKDKAVDKQWIENVEVSTESSYFCEFIYMLTMFLDGKEINDLITMLINKFENINALIDVSEGLGIYKELKSEYSIFNKCKAISENLRVVNSFARMKKPSNTSPEIVDDALKLFGYDINEQQLKRMFYLKEEEVEYALHGIYPKGYKKSLRNFLFNNVLESTRFKYIVKYCDPKEAQELSKCENLVRFVLSNIPPEQIDKYYKSCLSTVETGISQKISALTEMITTLSFEDFLNVKQDAKRGTAEGDDKEKKKAIIGLYLTVLYLAVKNLVYVNSRYVIAIHCLERDSKLISEEAKKFGYDAEYTHFNKRTNKSVTITNHTMLTNMFIDDNHKYINKRARLYLENNKKGYIPFVFTQYRNNIAHLSVLSDANNYINDCRSIDSYFELYHYIIQRILFKSLGRQTPNKTVTQESCDILSDYFDCLNKYKSYNMDFVKSLNYPFGYCLARYKNLSIVQLFDKNIVPDEKTAKNVKEF